MAHNLKSGPTGENKSRAVALPLYDVCTILDNMLTALFKSFTPDRPPFSLFIPWYLPC